MPRHTVDKNSLAELSRRMTDTLRRAATRPTFLGYKPHSKQYEFHTAGEKGRLYLGGNRGGKTVAGVVEDCWWLTGEHPYQDTPKPPVRGRVVAVDFVNGIEKNIIPEFARWMPPSRLINGSWEDSYNKTLRTLTLQNDSFVEFMSYDQDTDKFSQVSRHFTHFDEEPPKTIFQECLARLVDTGGHWWITMTPVDGMTTFVYDDIYLVGQKPDSDIRVIQVAMEENPYISPIEIEVYLSSLDDVTRKARGRGEFVEIGGTAFKSFSPGIHVIPSFLPPLHWEHYASMDHGFNNPTSWHWSAVSPRGIVITFDELYQSDTVVREFATLIKERNSQKGRRTPDTYVGDPAIKQRNGVTGTSVQTEYAMNGIPIVLGNNDQSYGVNKMNSYLRKPSWFITDNNPYLINQLQRVRWKTWATQKMRDTNNPKEQLQEHNNHATDDLRYLFSILPDVNIAPKEMATKEKAQYVLQELLTPVTGTRVGFTIDELLLASNAAGIMNDNDGWTVINEHMGGIY